MWLIGERDGDNVLVEPRYGNVLLANVFLLTLVQAGIFHSRYLDKGDERNFPFEHEYPQILAQALADPGRPIYLEEDPTYIHAYWYATIQGIDVKSFVHLLNNEKAPDGSLVISRRGTCSECQKIDRKGDFMLYRKTRSVPATPVP